MEPKRSIAPCKGCDKRNVTESYNCHDHCEEYAEFKAFSAARSEDNLRRSSAWAYDFGKFHYRFPYDPRSVRQRR